MSKVFRPMQFSDQSEIRSLFEEMSEESAGFINIARYNEKLTMRFFTEEGVPGHEFYVAVEEDHVLGYVFLWELHRSIPWIGIAVREACKGQHVGTFLMTETLEMLRGRGYGGLLLTTAKTNLRGQALYEKCGFERLGVHHSGEYLYLRRFDKK